MTDGHRPAPNQAEPDWAGMLRSELDAHSPRRLPPSFTPRESPQARSARPPWRTLAVAAALLLLAAGFVTATAYPGGLVGAFSRVTGIQLRPSPTAPPSASPSSSAAPGSSGPSNGSSSPPPAPGATPGGAAALRAWASPLPACPGPFPAAPPAVAAPVPPGSDAIAPDWLGRGGRLGVVGCGGGGARAR